MPDTVLIRSAMVSEQKTLEALQRRASLNNAGDRDALLANPDAVDLPLEQITANRVFIAERDGAILGFSAVLSREDGETELDALFVEPRLWRSGVGRLLVEHCAEVARAQGSSLLHVIGNPHAQGFYAACGFKMIGTIGTRVGVGLSLIKVL